MKLIFASAFVLLFAALQVSSQNSYDSPYSRYGIGDVSLHPVSETFGMGSLSSPMRFGRAININNPASYTAIDSASFVIQTGFFAKWGIMENATQSAKRSSGNLHSLLIGFKVSKRWGAAFGITPYSNIGYKIVDRGGNDSLSLYTNYYTGTGGLNRLVWGNAYSPLKNLHLGFNVNYLFGSLTQDNSIVFDSTSYFTNHFLTTQFVNGFVFDLGFQYILPLNDDYQMTFGGTFSPSSKLNATREKLMERVNPLNNYIVDTIVYSGDIKGKVIMPEGIRAGISLEKKNKWLLGIDAGMQDWSKYSSFGQSDSLRKSLYCGLGFSFTPDNNSITSYWSKATYSFGLRYTRSYLQLRETPLNDYGISFGIKLPMKPAFRIATHLRLGVEVGKYGLTENNLIQDKYIRLLVSLNLREEWFEKRKYN